MVKRLLDANAIVPDGTVASMHKALSVLGTAFHGTATLGYQSAGTGFECVASGPSDDHREQVSPVLRSALLEAAHSSNACLFATATAASSGVLQNVCSQQHAQLVLGLSAGSPERRIGIVICVPAGAGAEAMLSKEDYGQRIGQLQRELPAWLETWLLCRAGRHALKWSRRFRFYRQRQGRIGIVVTAALLLSLALPVPYWPRRECLVEPAARQFLSSPIDGRVIDAQVRPGDVVHSGQLLARLDDEQLRWDLAAAEANFESAAKRRDSALATRSGGELRLAQLDQERIAIEIDSIQKRLERLEIRSPLDGIVVQGDWLRSDGAPVDRGETLFEIAPLQKMLIETRLTSEDLAQIHVGDQATVRVDAAQGEQWQGRLARIDPRGQVIDSKVVFVAELDVENRDQLLRPGMKGSVSVSAGSRSLGWLLFHRPYVWVMKKLVW